MFGKGGLGNLMKQAPVSYTHLLEHQLQLLQEAVNSKRLTLTEKTAQEAVSPDGILYLRLIDHAMPVVSNAAGMWFTCPGVSSTTSNRRRASIKWCIAA